ncbi:MAG TPA: rhodanese-like domain-containing protein [Acidimicrobiales bacterium]|jgi:rhodanese-related sulfurtransferase|nr:rhodanese-like domain-containing protein [Acidimicrobiales bacterium]
MIAPLVTIEELAAAIADGPVPLVDVRQPEEYEAGHVPGAKLIPLADVVARTGEIPSEGPVYVICHTGPRSQRAADFYRNRGIEAYNVDGGTKAWTDAGHKLAHGPFPG